MKGIYRYYREQLIEISGKTAVCLRGKSAKNTVTI
jgi:hypothetical protein